MKENDFKLNKKKKKKKEDFLRATTKTRQGDTQ